MVSKAEFDSQRGSEDREQETDNDLVFGPLDQEDVAAAPGSAAPAKLEAVAAQRSAGLESELTGAPVKLSANGSSSCPTHQRRKDRLDRQARFYPVLNKMDSPSKVRIWEVEDNRRVYQTA